MEKENVGSELDDLRAEMLHRQVARSVLQETDDPAEVRAELEQLRLHPGFARLMIRIDAMVEAYQQTCSRRGVTWDETQHTRGIIEGLRFARRLPGTMIQEIRLAKGDKE